MCIKKKIETIYYEGRSKIHGVVEGCIYLDPLRSRHQNGFMCTGDLLGDMTMKDGGGRSRRRQGAPSVLHAGVMPTKGERGGGSDCRPGPWGTPKQVVPN